MIKTWNSDPAGKLAEKIQQLKDALAVADNLPCGRKSCVGYGNDCPKYGKDDNCMYCLVSDQLNLAETYPEKYAAYEADKAIKEKEANVAQAQSMLAMSTAELVLEQQGIISESVKADISNARSVEITKQQAFEAVAKYDDERSAILKTSEPIKEVSK
jgi:hypothetical protein